MSVRKRTWRNGAAAAGETQKLAELCGFPHLARVVLIVRHRGNITSGSMNMAKVETLAFAVSFIMTGFLTFVAMPLA